jgi:hypothetical protein
MTPWTLGLPLTILAFVIARLIWEDYQDVITGWLDRMADEVKETLESIGRLP